MKGYKKRKLERDDSKLGALNDELKLCEKARLTFFFATRRHFDCLMSLIVRARHQSVF